MLAGGGGTTCDLRSTCFICTLFHEDLYRNPRKCHCVFSPIYHIAWSLHRGVPSRHICHTRRAVYHWSLPSFTRSLHVVPRPLFGLTLSIRRHRSPGNRDTLVIFGVLYWNSVVHNWNKWQIGDIWKNNYYVGLLEHLTIALAAVIIVVDLFHCWKMSLVFYSDIV